MFSGRVKLIINAVIGSTRPGHLLSVFDKNTCKTMNPENIITKISVRIGKNIVLFTSLHFLIFVYQYFRRFKVQLFVYGKSLDQGDIRFAFGIIV